MLIEAFSQGKLHADRQANEDRFVLLPGRAYAVIDGVTDRLGSRYDGMLSGQYAAVTVKAALEQLLSAPDAPLGNPEALIAGVTAALQDGYRRHDTLTRARLDTNLRFACTLAAALIDGDSLLLVLVGDSGIRINGTDLYQEDKDLDRITAHLRKAAWEHLTPHQPDPTQREALARRVTWQGTGWALEDAGDRLTQTDMDAIEEAAFAAASAALTHVAPVDIRHLIRGGIVHAQGDYLNNAASPLGYSCLDGFEVPEGLRRIVRLPLADVRTIELFTDGYFSPASAVGVAAWEQHFIAIEQADPLKIGRYPSVKGSTPDGYADDRTYVAVYCD